MALLFLYGSFSPGQVHHNRVANFIDHMVPACTPGAVYRLEVGFPVFSCTVQGTVRGFLATLKDSPIILPVLDEFHGFSLKQPEKNLFHRVEVNVETADRTESAYVYAVNMAKLPKTAKIIEDSDWERSLQQFEPVTKALTDVQIKYITKLATSSGRDIVPINLQLYRELLNLGLIVDKGRRLALTPLGKEVYRFLE